MASRRAECIGPHERTQGTDTSQYLEERKSTETPSVAASESGIAQTGLRAGVAGAERSYKGRTSRSVWKGTAAEGDSPVGDGSSPPLPSAFQSSTELVELCVKLGGPPSKAKYYSATNSEE